MLHQLLSQLRGDLSLPKSLQIVGYLRRMEIFSEAELRLKFLQTRDTWFNACINTIPNEDGKWIKFLKMLLVLNLLQLVII